MKRDKGINNLTIEEAFKVLGISDDTDNSYIDDCDSVYDNYGNYKFQTETAFSGINELSSVNNANTHI